MITKGAPGKETPQTLYPGVWICIWYQIEGMFVPRCGSLQRIGRPLSVFLPLTAQLLLPLFFSGCNSSSVTVTGLLKYNESAVDGIFGSSPGGINRVPFGMIGSRLSGKAGYSLAKSSLLKKLFEFVIAKSLSEPASS